MANYFPVALTGTARSWLMNLPEGTLDSWPELCRQFTTNFESAYARPGNETDLHAVQQRSGEYLCSFIQRFSQVRNSIPHISNASVVVAFRQGVRDEKMLEKLATHDVQDVSTLFSLADKCARASEGRAWHSPAAPGSKEASKPNAGTSAQGVGGKGKKKRRLAVASRWPGHPPRRLSPQRRMGAGVAREATSAPANHPTMTRAVRSARYITPRGIPRRSAGRSRSSRNSSVKRCSNNRAKMAHPPASGRGSRR
jgi:hypothetical protein